MGITSATGELYRGPISLTVSFGSSKAPAWISESEPLAVILCTELDVQVICTCSVLATSEAA